MSPDLSIKQTQCFKLRQHTGESSSRRFTVMNPASES